jgi:hypothetical protein
MESGFIDVLAFIGGSGAADSVIKVWYCLAAVWYCLID